MEIKFFLVGPDSMSTFNLVSGNDRPKKSVLLATPSETLVKMGNEQTANCTPGENEQINEEHTKTVKYWFAISCSADIQFPLTKPLSKIQ